MDAVIPPELEFQIQCLNPAQREAVLHEGSPLLILAGAGSGKTRVITTKIAYLIAAKGFVPWSILAVTFTKKAAAEMAERACALDERASSSYIKTFHSFGAWLLRRYPEAAGVSPRFTVYDDNDATTLLTHALPALKRTDASRFAHCISLAKDYCLSPDSPELAQIDHTPEFPVIYRNYQERLRESGNVDFGDLIMLPVALLAAHADVRTHMQRLFRVIMVDEYQDSNVAQFMLLRQLAGDSTYVCVVGDDDQSIYRFRGAEVQNILSFQDRFAGTTIVKLEENYRSYEPILDVAGSVVQCNRARLGKTLRAQRSGGEKPALFYLDDQDEEARFVATLIEKSRKTGAHYADWAVLYRMNAQSLGFEIEFLRRKIPYTVVGSLKFFEREEIKDALAYLAFIANPHDEISFTRIVNKPVRGVGTVSRDKIATAATGSYLDRCKDALVTLPKKAATGVSEFVSVMTALFAILDSTDTTRDDTMQLSAFVGHLIELSGLSFYHHRQDDESGTQRLANLQELVNTAALYPQSWTGLLDFLDHIELDRTLASETADAGRDAVTLITLHNTKGLEFPRVIITGMEHGVFPRTDKSGDELEEERRLCYVGMTRARDELYLTCCRQRRIYGRTDYMSPSPFLADIDSELLSIHGHRTNAQPSWSKPIIGTKILHAAQTDSPPSAAHTDDANPWAKGTKLYHDDYGYGIVTQSSLKSGELVIVVQFENGGEKRFFPQYQSSSLMRIRD